MDAPESKGGKVNWAKRRGLATAGVLGLFLLFSHQNCAPAKGGSASSATGTSVSIPEDSSPVSIIDGDKSSAAVSFSQTSMALDPSAATLDVTGVCSLQQQDAVLGWQLLQIESDGSAGSAVLKGYASCENGAFIVHLGSPTQFVCGQKYDLVAQLGYASPGNIAVSVACPSSN